jgi:hypothetical protein
MSICTAAGCETEGKIRGLCRSHYNKGRNDGSLVRIRGRGRQGQQCEFEVDGVRCERQIFAKEFCATHYQSTRARIVRAWRAVRHNHTASYPAPWDSLPAFLAAVGEPPDEKHQLRRIDDTAPWTADNAVWRAPVRFNGKTGLTANMADYQRWWRYLRRFGLTERDVEEMMEAQSRTCPICLEPLGELGAASRYSPKVVIDHDHVTGALRSFLHDGCNKGIGSLRDNADNCQRAADYLRHHAANPTPRRVPAKLLTAAATD